MVLYDFLKERRVNEPVSPMWRLLDPHAGGHVFFVPCWVIGAVGVFMAWAGMFEFVTRSGYLDPPSFVLGFGFAGFVFPPVCEYFWLFGFYRSLQSKVDDDESEQLTADAVLPE